MLAGDFGNRWTSGYDDPTEGSINCLFSLRAKTHQDKPSNFRLSLGREVPVLVHSPVFGDIDSGLQGHHDVCTILVDFLKVQGGTRR